MKALVIAAATVLATFAQAHTPEKETIVCTGIEQSQGYSLTLEARGTIFMDESEQNLSYKNANGQIVHLLLACQVK